ncbi:MAG TPA: 5-formyltetrahydrofolate cyclo-ligase [Cyclobacteriaceae bacterium]|nr:5-formyltetrahydrofolate cyclo-ligase [Cyclobacteriaceae bacterium]
MTKQELRKAYLQKRITLKDTEYVRLSKLLCEMFFKTTELSSVHTLHTFLPIVRNREPDTQLIIDKLKHDYAYVKISIPKINSEGSMESYFMEGSKIKSNSWGIPEPIDGILTEPSTIDMILVPLLAFDKEGYRVGYGKGYYDRFLKECRPDAKKIGLSFFPPEEKIQGLFSEDFRLNAVITPDERYTFSN